MKVKQYRTGLLSLLALLMFAAAACIGCQKADEDKKNNNKSTFEDVAAKLPSGDDAETAKPLKAPEPPPEPTIPDVALTEKDADASLVKVGDAMPGDTLQDLNGKHVELHSLLGEKLSVICFWNGSQTSGLQAIQELGKYVAVPYAENGVAVIGINVGDTPQVAKEKAALAKAEFPILLDGESSYFKKVAAETLPRVYLLDADGKVLWFDIGYSRSMRRDLLQGIDFTLAK